MYFSYFRDLKLEKIPCTSLTKCIPPPKISKDTAMTFLSPNNMSVIYSCQDDHLFDNKDINFPSKVTATCTENEIMNGFLPFWKIDGMKLPSSYQSLCKPTKRCINAPPAIPDGFTVLWDGTMDIGSQVQYYCGMKGPRSHVKFLTEDDDIKKFHYKERV